MDHQLLCIYLQNPYHNVLTQCLAVTVWTSCGFEKVQREFEVLMYVLPYKYVFYRPILIFLKKFYRYYYKMGFNK